MSHNEPDTIDADDNNTIGIVDHLPSPQDLAMPTAVTDFARKLYKKAFFFTNTRPMAYIDLCSMLEDPSNQSIVCWGPQRDCFIVKDTNEFAKSTLPRIYNHSNFASFVRQLNKYDFHKVKQTDFTQAGEQISTFRHQDFHADRPEDLQKIKRKLAIPKAPGGTSSGSQSQSTEDSSSSLPYASSSNSHPYRLSSNSNSNQSHSDNNSLHPNMNVEVSQLREENEDLKSRIRQLEKNHETMKAELKDINRDVARQHGQTQVLLNLLGSLSVESPTSISLGTEGTRMPAAATAISMSMSTSGGILGRVPAQTDHFREMGHQAPELQGQDIHMQSDVDQQGESVHSPTNAGVLAARFSEQLDERRVIDFGSASARSTVFGNLGQVGQATLMQTREVSGGTAAGLWISGTEHDLERHTRQLSRMDYGEEGQLTMSRGSHNPFPSPVGSLQTSPYIEMERNQEAAERPHPAPAVFSTYNIHVESPGQQRDNGTNFGPAARDEFNGPSGGSELAQDVGGFMGSQPGHGPENDTDHDMEREGQEGTIVPL